MREMKKTGVVWLPVIPNDWEIDRVKNSFTISKDLSPEDNPTVLKLARSGVQVKDVTTNEGQMAASYENYNKVQSGDLLLNPMDLYSGANCNVSEISGVISPAYANLRPNGNVNSKFFDYYFKIQYWTMAMFAHGKGVSYDNRWTINNDSIKNYEIPVPSYAEQCAVVDCINANIKRVDALTANQEQQIEKLKAYKQSLITEVVTKGLNPNMPMKPSGVEWIGDIPEHWKVSSFKSVATTCSGGTPNSNDETLYDGDINWVCSYDLKEKPIISSGRKISQKGADSISGIMQKKGSILIAMYGGSGTIGNSGILECEARTNQALCSVKFDNYFFNDYYCFYYILSIRRHWMIYAVGTRKDPNISQEIVKAMPCIIPSLSEQKQIVDYLDKRCAKIDMLIEIKQQKIDKLNDYKKSLIYEYVTGKKEVV